MIITIRNQATSDERAQLMAQLCRITGNLRPITATRMNAHDVLVFDATALDRESQVQLEQQRAVERVTAIKTPYQLVSRAYKPTDSTLVIGNAHDCEQVIVGGDQPVIMAGPCAVENREQLLITAKAVKQAGANVLRGGAFKPRTSPYQFQGLGMEGLHLLAEAREITGLPIITEVMEPDMVDTVAQHADVLQIGSRNMQNYPLLLAIGRHSAKRPVLLKRGLSASIEEWLLAAEYIVASGNPNVILCERGIRSFDQQTRNVLDLTCVPLLQELTHLPIIIDPSHATGHRHLITPMSRASIAAGADGLIIEVHPDPNNALCDGKQSITPEQLQRIVHEAHLFARMLNEEIRVGA
ncbi:MAG TPA: 3-deoxy-7-phosphoheptulonate synthase [Ktedonobacter sp.]|nr:3-deoxy-7-phosphoheptulonate synthase [Ktedonobacter sp.]